MTSTLASTTIDSETAPRRGAPVLQDEEKRTATFPLRTWKNVHSEYENYCRANGLKIAEFYREAMREYLINGKHVRKPDDARRGSDKLYILHMTALEKEKYDAFAKNMDVSLVEVIRTAAEKYFKKCARKNA